MALRSQKAIELYNMGLEYYQQGRWQEAVAAWESSLTHNAEFVEALENLGTVYLQVGHPSKGRAYLTRATIIDSQRASLFYNRALTWVEPIQFEQALADYSQALHCDPTYPNAHCNRGVVYLKQGYFTKAQADFVMALQVDPHDSAATQNLQIVKHVLNLGEDPQRSLQTPLEVIGALRPTVDLVFDEQDKVAIGIEPLDEYRKGADGQPVLQKQVLGIMLYVSQQPEVIIRVTLDVPECSVMIMREKRIVAEGQSIMTLASERVDRIVAQADMLTTHVAQLLNDLQAKV